MPLLALPAAQPTLSELQEIRFFVDKLAELLLELGPWQPTPGAQGQLVVVVADTTSPTDDSGVCPASVEQATPTWHAHAVDAPRHLALPAVQPTLAGLLGELQLFVNTLIELLQERGSWHVGAAEGSALAVAETEDAQRLALPPVAVSNDLSGPTCPWPGMLPWHTGTASAPAFLSPQVLQYLLHAEAGADTDADNASMPACLCSFAVLCMLLATDSQQVAVARALTKRTMKLHGISPAVRGPGGVRRRRRSSNGGHLGRSMCLALLRFAWVVLHG